MAPLTPELATTLAPITAGAFFGQLVPPAHEGGPLESRRSRYLLAAGGALGLGLALSAMAGGARGPVFVALATAGGLVAVSELAGRLAVRAGVVDDQGAVAGVHAWG